MSGETGGQQWAVEVEVEVDSGHGEAAVHSRSSTRFLELPKRISVTQARWAPIHYLNLS